MINQYFNVYALRRVRTAGYATVQEVETGLRNGDGYELVRDRINS